jgi:hypothetical protein
MTLMPLFCDCASEIGYDVLEKYEDVVGRTRDQRRVCGAVGRRDSVSL